MPDDELIDIVNRAKPLEWQLSMLNANVDPYEMTWDEAIQYFERLELAADMQEQASKMTKEANDKQNKKKRKQNEQQQSSSTKQDETTNKPDAKTKKWCQFCKRPTHNTSDCWTKQRAEKQTEGQERSAKRQKTSPSSVAMFTPDQVNWMMQCLPSTQTKRTAKKKRKVRFEKDNSDDDAMDPTSFFTHTMNNKRKHNSDESSSEYLMTAMVNTRLPSLVTPGELSTERKSEKKQKCSHVFPQGVIQLKDRQGVERPIRALFNSGTTGVIAL